MTPSTPLENSDPSPLPWSARAEESLSKVPFFVRPLVRRKVEHRVRQAGGRQVSLDDFQDAEKCFRALSAGKDPAELKAMMPAPNRPGVEMVLLESCRSELAGCPNGLLDTAPWREALEAWLRESGISERLRAKLEDDKVLYHHKIKLAMAACPNGCSRPQIAGLSLVGFVRPHCDYDACDLCGFCQEACPDQAITLGREGPIFHRQACQGCLSCGRACPSQAIGLSPARMRVFMGGKLGRHPHLAEPVGEARTPAQALEIIAPVLESYIEQGRRGERFSDWWLRSQKAGD